MGGQQNAYRVRASVLLFLLFVTAACLADEADGEEADSENLSSIRNLSAGNDAFGIEQGDLRTFLSPRYTYDPSTHSTTRELGVDAQFAVGLFDDLSGILAVSYLRNDVEVDQDVPSLGLEAGDGDTTTGFQSLDLELQYNWLSEVDLRPNVAIGMSASIPNGRPTEPSALGQATTSDGFRRLRTSLHLAKNFYATSLYGAVNIDHTPSRDTKSGTRIDPGTSVGLRGSVSFSVNAYVTLNGGWNANWSEKTKIDGEVLEASNRDRFSVNAGATLRIANDTYLRQSFDFGVAGTDTTALTLTFIHLQ